MRIRWVAFVGAALFPLFGCATGENPEAAVDRGVVSVDGGSICQWLGDSRGRWEGDTLVVDTVRFNNRLDGGVAPQGSWTVV